MFRFLFLWFYLLTLAVQLQAQTSIIDELKKQVYTATNSQEKLQALYALCEQRQSMSTDTLCKYAGMGKDISVVQKDISNIGLAEYYYGYCLVKNGKLDTVIQICNSNISKLKKKGGEVNTLMKLIFLKGHVLVRSNKHKEGLAEYYTLLKKAEQSKDTVMQMVAKNGIGWVNMEMDQNHEALSWFFKALNTSDNQDHHQKNSNIYSNIAAVYKQLNKHDSAEYYVKTAISFASRNQNIFTLANSLNILADIYISTKRPALAEAPLKQALALRKQIGDPFYIVSDMSQLAIYYANISEPQKGIELSRQGIKLAEQYNLSSKLPYLYSALGENYKAAGNHEEYSKTLEVVMNLKDSMYAATSAEARAEMDTRYNVQKQETIIVQQKLDLLRQNYVLYGTLAVIFFGAVISWLLFNNYKKKQKLIMQAVKEEEKLKALQAVMLAEENERRRISADLHDNLGSYASAISANADDLARLSGSVDNQIVNTIKTNATEIMASLRDTIWVLNKNEILLTSVSDRFKNYIRKIRESYPSLTIETKENIQEDISLSPQNALNLLRIMQEAFHNAIKHSKGNHIIIELNSDNGLQIRIMDNGKGLSTDDSKYGNGFINMQSRAKANGWKLDIKSMKPTGTTVELVS
jgi:signal transduction histidine kinase